MQVWEGDGVVEAGRTLFDSECVIVASDAVESAQKEISLWFTPEELCEKEMNLPL